MRITTVCLEHLLCNNYLLWLDHFLIAARCSYAQRFSRMALKYTCSVCYAFSAPNYQSVIRHIGSVHSWEPHFRITCGVDGCPRSYSSYRSFRKHIMDKHQEILSDGNTEPAPADEDADFSDDTYTPCMASQTSVAQRRPNNIDKALFLLKLKEERRISQRNIDFLVDDITVLVQDEIRSLKKEVISTIQQSQSVEDSITMVSQMIDQKSSTSPFVGLESARSQRKCYLEHFHLVVCSITYFLTTIYLKLHLFWVLIIGWYI